MQGERRFFMGFDPAKVNDRSALCMLEKFDDGSYETRMFLNLQGMDYRAQVPEVIRIFRDYKVRSIAIDATGHEQLYEEIKDALGYGRVKKITFTKAVKEDLVLILRLLCQDRKLRIGRGFKFYNLLRKEMHDLIPQKLDHPPGGSSDIFWSLALAVNAGEFRYIQAKKVRLPIFDQRGYQGPPPENPLKDFWKIL